MTSSERREKNTHTKCAEFSIGVFWQWRWVYIYKIDLHSGKVNADSPQYQPNTQPNGNDGNSICIVTYYIYAKYAVALVQWFCVKTVFFCSLLCSCECRLCRRSYFAFGCSAHCKPCSNWFYSFYYFDVILTWNRLSTSNNRLPFHWKFIFIISFGWARSTPYNERHGNICMHKICVFHCLCRF